MGVKIRERPKGSGVWWIYVNHRGRRKAKRVGSKGAALEVKKQLKARLTLGGMGVLEKEKVFASFVECAQVWISLPHDWTISTRRSYKNHLDKYILPAFGKLPIDEIKRRHIKGFFDELQIKGLAPGTISQAKAALSGVFTHAVDSEIIEQNPLWGMTLKGRRQKFKIEPLTEKESEKLLKAAREHLAGQYYPHILCALRTGMRLGELKALKWEDINFEKRLIEVKRSCRRGVVSDTKTHRARLVDMTPQLSETLYDLRTQKKREVLKQGRPFPEWVFANKKGEIFLRQPFWFALNRCLKAVVLRQIRIHDLRHTYATIRLLRGHNVGDVSYQLGHASIQMTFDVYGHWIPGRFKNEVDELDLQPKATQAQPKNKGVNKL